MLLLLVNIKNPLQCSIYLFTATAEHIKVIKYGRFTANLPGIWNMLLLSLSVSRQRRTFLFKPSRLESIWFKQCLPFMRSPFAATVCHESKEADGLPWLERFNETKISKTNNLIPTRYVALSSTGAAEKEQLRNNNGGCNYNYSSFIVLLLVLVNVK